MLTQISFFAVRNTLEGSALPAEERSLLTFWYLIPIYPSYYISWFKSVCKEVVCSMLTFIPGLCCVYIDQIWILWLLKCPKYNCIKVSLVSRDKESFLSAFGDDLNAKLSRIPEILTKTDFTWPNFIYLLRHTNSILISKA